MRQASSRFTEKVSALAPYEDHIVKRRRQGCRTATQTWREVSEQGYPGARQNVVRIPRYLKEPEVLENPTRAVRRVSPPGKRPAPS